MEEADIEDIKVEQCALICFLTVKETLNELRKGNNSHEILPEKTVYRWHKAFQDAWKSLVSQPKSGQLASQLTEVNVNTINVMIRENRHLSARALEELTNISTSTIYHIMTETDQNLFQIIFF